MADMTEESERRASAIMEEHGYRPKEGALVPTSDVRQMLVEALTPTPPTVAEMLAKTKAEADNYLDGYFAGLKKAHELYDLGSSGHRQGFTRMLESEMHRIGER